jgi:hypothetical protein
LLHNTPKTADGLIRNFLDLDMVGKDDTEHIGILYKILLEDFSYKYKDLYLVMDRIEEERNIKNLNMCILFTDNKSDRKLQHK